MGRHRPADRRQVKAVAARALLAGLALAILAGCAGSVRVKERAARPPVDAGRYDTREVDAALAALVGVDLRGVSTPGVEATLGVLDAAYAASRDPFAALAGAEVRLRWAERAALDDATRAWGYADAARRAMVAVGVVIETSGTARPGFETGFRKGVSIHNRAAGRFAVATHPLTSTIEVARADGVDAPTYRVGVTPPEPDRAFDASFFDRLRLADELEVKGLEARFQRLGLGAALVGEKDNRAESDAGLNRFPPEGVYWPATATLIVESLLRDAPVDVATYAADHELRFTLHDPLGREAVTIRGDRAVLRVDTTAADAALFSVAEVDELRLAGLLNPDKAVAAAGLYMLEPYRKGKAVVVMVHGLLSSPLTWVQMHNTLRGDPLIRDRYQFWHFFYPTGVPFPSSAAVLRRELRAIRDEHDPGRAHRASRDVVLVGHSMGGLIVKLVASDSGDAVWDAVYAKPFAQFVGDPDDLAALRAALYWEPDPAVTRVVFLATPHRGSDLATGLVGTLGRKLAGLSQELETIGTRTLSQNEDALTDDLRRYRNLIPTSVETLEPNTPFLLAIQDVWDRTRSAAFHSVIGDRGKRRGDVAESSDGVVDYWSAHLDGAESELIVPSGHNAHEDPAAIAEVRRILRAHALAEEDESDDRAVPAE